MSRRAAWAYVVILVCALWWLRAQLVAEVGVPLRQAVALGLPSGLLLDVAMALGILFQKFNVGFLVGWAFNVAASANLPALVMLLFWRGTTKQGITAAIFVGMLSSLGWILLSQQCFKDVYGLPPEKAIVPFSQPGIVTIPLGFVVLIAVSLATSKPAARAAV